MFRLLSGHEWSVGGGAREGSGREEERGYLVSGSKNGTFTERGPLPAPIFPVGRSEDAAMRKVAPQEAGNQRYDDLRQASNYSCIFCQLEGSIRRAAIG